MSISVQGSQGINNINPTQDLQKSTSLHGRAFHKITDGGKYIIRSINNIAQSALSTCIRIVSFGRYNLDSLKSYLFSNQTALKGNDTTSSNSSLISPPPNTPFSLPPPPPKMPTPDDLNRASSSRLSTKVQPTSFQEPMALRAESAAAGIRSSFNPEQQDSSEEEGNILDGGTDSRRSSLHEGSDHRIEDQGASSSVHSQKKKKGIQKKLDQGKQVIGGLLAGMQNNPLFQKKQRESNQE